MKKMYKHQKKKVEIKETIYSNKIKYSKQFDQYNFVSC